MKHKKSTKVCESVQFFNGGLQFFYWAFVSLNYEDELCVDKLTEMLKFSKWEQVVRAPLKMYTIASWICNQLSLGRSR